MNRIFVGLLFLFPLLSINELFAQSYFVQWQNLVGVDVQDQKITSTASTGWANSGAYSLNSLSAGQDGWVEIRIPFQNNFEKMIGLADADEDQHYTSIDYAFYIQSSLYIYEKGSNKLNLGTFTAGEILRIERIGTTILYKRNGTIVYTSTVASSTSLNADISFYRQNAYFENMLVSFPVVGQQPDEITYDIAWTDLVGVSVEGNTITKTAAGGWGNGGAASINLLNANTDGWIEYQVDALNKLRTFGFSDTNTDASYNTIDYAWHTNGTDCYVFLNGSNVGNYPLQVNDILRIERIGSEMLFKLNGVTKKTVTNVNTGFLIADCAMSDSGAKITNTKASFWIPYQQGLVPDQWEFAALKDIYDSLGGPTWTNKTNWPTIGNWPTSATAVEMDTWHGVTVANGDITQVLTNNNNLIGKIPSSISNLSQLTHLYFYNNSITGEIPSTIGMLTNLQFLYLYNNQLSGNIPAEIGNLEKLVRLYLQSNKLTGSIPIELNNLSSIQYFLLSTNLLSGDISDLSGLLTLVELNVGGNPNFSNGIIPNWISSLSNLKILNLSNTNRTGEIPSWIGSLSSLTHLYLHVNQLTGNIPYEIGSMASLQYLYLYNNQLSGSIPNSISNLNNLLYLYLASNQLSGSIPSVLGSMSNLVYLHLGSNKLSGSIPSSIGNLNNLTHLYLNTNQLSGAIPTSLSGLIKVSMLYLHTNQLSGEIPSSIGSLTKLQYLQLGGNQLIGNIPSSFSGLTSMRLFYANSNFLSGDIPPAIGSWPLLNAFNVNYNKFKSLPNEILNNPILTSVSLYNNEVTSIPDFSSYTNRANLVLDVRGNRMSFSELETLYGGWIKTLQLTGQKTINDISHASIMGSLTIPARPLTPNTTIIWEKQNGTSWVNVNSSNGDATGQTFYIASASAQDEGVYRYKMTNSVVTGMTIQSEPITVKTAKAFALDNWAFQYKYDGRNRMTHKKVPGADWMYMVYDSRDRLVMTQDGEQRKLKKWSFTKYDVLNRPIITGVYTHSSSVDQQTMSGLISTTQFYDVFDGVSPNTHGYTNNVFPKGDQQGTKFEPFTITYYDNYDFLSENELYAYRPNLVEDKTINGVTYSQPGIPFFGTRGQVTGQDVRTLGSLTLWERQVNYYDEKYNPIQNLRDDHRGSVEIATQLFDFTGKPLAQKTVNESTTVSWQNLVGIVTDGNDKLIRLQGVGWDAGASSVEVLAANEDGWLEVTAPLTNTNQIIG
ncbi:MAG: leucine-rich repeat domain-containing protein, partial [Cyclobacteriaceae bacterium]